ncbi:MAG: hypothetical protein FWG66_09980 [Spirochaetes bacterium]|nr:hypothetical protein [Spirochaetota bacterium]
MDEQDFFNDLLAKTEAGQPPSKPPNCLKCEHFKVTWDVVYPRSCNIFSIRCSNLPSNEVFRATKAHCPFFRQKEGLK